MNAGSLCFNFRAQFHQALCCFPGGLGFDLWLDFRLSRNGENDFKSETCQASPATRSCIFGGANNSFESQRTSGYSSDTFNCNKKAFNGLKLSKSSNYLNLSKGPLEEFLRNMGCFFALLILGYGARESFWGA